ncbi:hypothetical protein [Hydrogenivirga sp. 128-5-R1-1]|uniref:hypothetical protein n=1 Tax=Hydrogenivirga sp. 128-5-R1-1 TaxID=392423 RepID=UPI000303DBD6|nr:hypothetical protein [Hydrogenivirga sp. 128-5-R1-1]
MIKKLFSIVIVFSLYSIIFHFHSDFSYHPDCPVCVSGVDDEKTITINVSIKEKPIIYKSKYFFNLKENLKSKNFKRTFLQRAPPEV